jgi:hypothetical protein
MTASVYKSKKQVNDLCKPAKLVAERMSYVYSQAKGAWCVAEKEERIPIMRILRFFDSLAQRHKVSSWGWKML